MPRRTDISFILVIGTGTGTGTGPIIGQTCEFDYVGTQAITQSMDL